MKNQVSSLDDVAASYFPVLERDTNAVIFDRTNTVITFEKEPGTYYQMTDGAYIQVTLPHFSGFEGVTEDAWQADAPAEYYNLQGIRVANPAHGIYIERRGSKATKVLIP